MGAWEDFFRAVSLCAAKDTTIKTSRRLTEQGKMLANHVPNKGLVSKIHKELTQLNTPNQRVPVKSGQKTRTDTSPKKTQRGHEM